MLLQSFTNCNESFHRFTSYISTSTEIKCFYPFLLGRGKAYFQGQTGC